MTDRDHIRPAKVGGRPRRGRQAAPPPPRDRLPRGDGDGDRGKGDDDSADAGAAVFGCLTVAVPLLWVAWAGWWPWLVAAAIGFLTLSWVACAVGGLLYMANRKREGGEQ